MTVAADPDLLRLVPSAVDDLGDRVARTAGELTDALDRVLATCVDHRPAVGPVDHELRALVARWRAAGADAGRFAAELAAADSGSLASAVAASGWAVGNAVLDEVLRHPELAARIIDALDGDPTADDIDAVFDTLSRLEGTVGDLGAARTFAEDLGRLLASAGMPRSALARWATRANASGLSHWAKVGRVYALADDARDLHDAFTGDRSGAHQVAVVSRTVFDVSSAACSVAPNPYTCGTAVVSGVVWGAAEIYDRRQGIGQVLGAGTQLVRKEAVELREVVETHAGAWLEQGRDLMGGMLRPDDPYGPVVPLVPPGIAPLVDQTKDFVVDRYEERKAWIQDRSEEAKAWVGDRASDVGNVAGTVVRAIPGLG